MFNAFAECMNSAPGIIINNRNYVTKVVFPLELLGITSAGTAIFQSLIGLAILIVFEFFVQGNANLTLIMLPLIWIQLACWCCGLSLIIGAANVYVRDIEQIMPLVTSILMFLSAVFYPLGSLPEWAQGILYFNPISNIIEQVRSCVIDGEWLSKKDIITCTMVSIGICEMSFRTFKKAKRGFGDVI